MLGYRIRTTTDRYITYDRLSYGYALNAIPKLDREIIKDTPETKNSKTGKMYFGKEASEFTKENALNKNVAVYLDKTRTRDKYNRLLAYIQLPDKSFLNELLVREGYAYADLRFKHQLYNKYQQLEALARKNKKGLWKDVTRQQLPGWLKRERPKLLAK